MTREQRPLVQSEWTPLLASLAGLAALAGAMGELLASEQEGAAALSGLAARTVAGTPGLVLGGLAAGLVGLALLLSLLDRLWPWPPGAASPAFSDLESGNLRRVVAEVRERVTSCFREDGGEVSVALDELLRGALLLEASDLHLTPSSEGTVATYRVHGSLHEVALLPREMASRMGTRIKVLARIDPFSPRPQDGRLLQVVGRDRVEARVSTLRTDLGERVVLRLVRSGLAVPTLDQLGFPPALQDALGGLLARPQGLLFVSGPVGSGKTTTLYTALQHVATTRGRTTSLVSLEDPIELQLPFVTQTQINPKVGLTFAQTLRSVLRQDPNVLMLGEIRDRETAEIAAQAGLTGHLILTTLHVDRAAGMFARMIEMDIEPFVLASATVGSLAQRLVRTLCTHCATPTPPTALELDRLRALGVDALPEGSFLSAPGCEYCEGQGYTGRTPVAELLVVTPELRRAVNERRPTEDLTALALSQGMVPLLTAGLERARAGETSLAEVLRVVT